MKTSLSFGTYVFIGWFILCSLHIIRALRPSLQILYEPYELQGYGLFFVIRTERILKTHAKTPTRFSYTRMAGVRPAQAQHPPRHQWTFRMLSVHSMTPMSDHCVAVLPGKASARVGARYVARRLQRTDRLSGAGPLKRRSPRRKFDGRRSGAVFNSGTRAT